MGNRPNRHIYRTDRTEPEQSDNTGKPGLNNYFKAAICLILASNTPPTPPHAGGGMGWGEGGGWGV